MWNNIEFILDEDETVNNAFCTNPFFRIRSEGNVTSNPHIEAYIQNKKTVLAINESLFLLEDQKCNFLSFDSTIDCVFISEIGNIIICALKNGNIHGIHIKSVPLFNLTIDKKDIGYNKTCIGIQFYNDAYYLMCANGAFYKILNIDESNTSEMIEPCDLNDTLIFDQTVMGSVTIERVLMTGYVNDLTTFVLLPSSKDNKEPYIIAANSNSVVFIEANESIVIAIPEIFEGVKKIVNFKSRIVGLTNKGDLFEVCQFTRNLYPIPNSEQIFIDDFIVLEDSDNGIDLLILDKSNEQISMKITQFPKMTTSYELPNIGISWLVHQLKSSVNMYYISGKFDYKNILQEIVMNKISELEPTEQFKKLIRKGYLEEAEEFANTFNLSTQPILEEKIKRLLIDLSYEKNIAVNSFDLVMDLIREIKNKKFLLDIQHADIPKRNWMEIFLQYLIKTLDEVEFQNDVEEINERILRIETLDIIDPYECYNEWYKFVISPDLLQKCVEMIKNDIHNACIIWSRHASAIVPFLKKQAVTLILSKIPSTTPPFDLILWIRHFAPSVLHSNPSMMVYLVDWSLKHIEDLQSSNLWPDIGLEYVKNIFDIFNDINLSHSESQVNICIIKIKETIEVIEDLSVLKKSFNLNISYQEYIQKNLEEFSFRLLQKVQIDILTKLVKEFIFPKLNRNCVSTIKVMEKYIRFLVTHRKQILAWQERAVVALDLIYNEEIKLTCVLLLLNHAPVPWNDTIKSLIKYGSSNHPLASQILIQYKWEIMKLLKIKYGWFGERYIIHRILKLDLPEMIDDIKIVISFLPTICIKSNFFLVNKLIGKCELDSALHYIDGLECDLKKNTIEFILTTYANMIDSNSIDENQIDNVIELLNLLNIRLEKPDSVVTDIKNIYKLRLKFNLDINLETYYNKENKINFLRLAIENLMEQLKNQEDTDFIEILLTKFIKLSELLNLNLIFTFYIIAKHLDNIYISSNIAYLLIDMEIDTIEYTLDLIALLLVQHFNFKKSYPTSSDDLLVYPIVYQLLEKLLVLKNEKIDSMEIIQFLRWTRIGKNLYETEVLNKRHQFIRKISNKAIKIMFDTEITTEVSTIKRSKNRDSFSVFDQIEVEKNLIVSNEPEQVLNCISNAIYMLIFYYKLEDSIFLRLKKLMNHVEKQDSIRDTFISSLEIIIKTKEHDSAYCIIQNVNNCGNFNGIKILPYAFTHLIYKKMIKYALALKELDYIELQHIITILLSDEKSSSLISELKSELRLGIQKTNFYNLLEIYYQCTGDLVEAKNSAENRKRNYYMNELCKSNSILTFDINLDFISISKFMEQLGNKIIDVNLLKKLSSDFNWDYQAVLIVQIKSILINHELEFDIENDVFGKEIINIKTDYKTIVKLCQPYVDEITDTEVLAVSLIRLMETINVYFYELFKAIIYILDVINQLPQLYTQWNEILSFIQYKMIVKRRTAPGEFEQNCWLESNHEKGVLPKISKYRFPFKLIVENSLRVVLEDEVSITTCVSWFPLISLHAILQKKDTLDEITKLKEFFVMAAVKNSIKDYTAVLDDPFSEVWHLEPVNNAFLQSFLRLLEHMNCPIKKLYLLYYVSNHAPKGADLIEASFECYTFAIKNMDILVQDERALANVSKIKRKYPIYKTQYLLYMHGITEDDPLFSLIEDPRSLIIELYNHEFLTKKLKMDINKIAQEIAKFHSIDLEKLQLELIHKWLAFSNDQNIDPDETCYEDLNISNIDEEINNECIAKAYIILKSWNNEQAIKFVISHMTERSNVTNTKKQLNLYECLKQLYDETNASYANFIQHKDYLIVKCVHELKQVGWNYSIKKFTESDKVDILKKLWRHHANDRRALEIMSHICLGFDICIPKIWNSVLKQMASLNMVTRLSSLINILSIKISILHLDGFALAWECVILSVFKDANREQTFEQESSLCKALLMLQTCPVASKLDLILIGNECIRLNRPYMAAVLISFAKKEVRNKLIELVLLNKTTTLQKDIFKLEELGVISTITKFVVNELKL